MKNRLRPQDEDTICAPITPYGRGGVSVLRVSGPKALNSAQKICPFLPKNPSSHQAYYGLLQYEGKDIDTAVVLFFEEGRSFTSEQTVEFSCHGSPVVCEEILQILQDLGCRIADRGEFTYRAFLSGKVDLIQAESILTLIESQSQKAKRQALRSLKGEFSRKLQNLQDQIQNVLAHIEAEIDFSEENLKTLSSENFLKQVNRIQREISEMVRSYKQGLYVREGLKVGIFGNPNSGKSTLLNQFLKEDRAIVSEQEGTTRDKIEGVFFIKGQKISVVDTAGLRESSDSIEQEGLRKTLETLETSDVCLYILDGSKSFEYFFKQVVSHSFHKDSVLKLSGEKDQKENSSSFYCMFYEKFFSRWEDLENVVFVVNKIDLKPKEQILSDLKKNYPDCYSDFLKRKIFFISAQKGWGIEEIKQFFLQKFQDGEEAVHLPRHYELFKQAQENLQKTQELLKRKETPLEFVAFELKSTLGNIQNILGLEVNMDVLDEIFQQFCIGK